MDSRIIPGFLAFAAAAAIAAMLLWPHIPALRAEAPAAVETEPPIPAVTVARAREGCLPETVLVTGWLTKGPDQKTPVSLEAEIPEMQMPRLAAGQPARIEVSGAGTVSGRVGLVAPEIDRATHLGRVRIDFDADARLKSSGFGRGTVETGRSCGVAIPLSAVLYRQDGTFVQVIRNDKVATRRVRVGLVRGASAVVQDGVADGDLVVAVAGTFLRDGDAAKPVVADEEIRGSS